MFFSKNKNPFTKDRFNKKSVLTFLKNFIIGSTTARKMFRLYFLILIIFACLLYLPISFQGDYKFEHGEYIFQIFDKHTNKEEVFQIDFLDVLFTAFSAFSDTGLVVAPTYAIFSVFGKVMLMILIQIGGFGIMFFIFLVWKLFMRRDKISINQMLMAQAEKGTTKIGQTSKMLISTSISIIILEFFFGLFYSLWFLYYPAYEQESNGYFTHDILSKPIDLYHNVSNAFFAGFFHSVSSINNAGFDIIGAYSLASYKNDWNAFFLLITATEFILGGIGFPILYDLFSKFSIKKKEIYSKNIKSDKRNFKIKLYSFKIIKNKMHKVSLLTKLAVSSTFVISLFSIGLWFLFETTIIGAGNNYLWNDQTNFGTGALGYFNKSVQIIFQAVSTRSAGFSTIDCNQLNQSTKWLATFLMFVGASPSSTAGGIRTTTFAITFITIISRLIGRRHPSVFHRRFIKEEITNSFIVFFTALFLIALGGIVLAASVNKHGEDVFSNCIFDASSSFGTTGLSTIGYYYEVHWTGKLYLMFLMFIGQFGISSTLLALNRKKLKTNRYTYIEETATL